jgi:hypothetical protein
MGNDVVDAQHARGPAKRKKETIKRNGEMTEGKMREQKT